MLRYNLRCARRNRRLEVLAVLAPVKSEKDGTC